MEDIPCPVHGGDILRSLSQVSSWCDEGYTLIGGCRERYCYAAFVKAYGYDGPYEIATPDDTDSELWSQACRSKWRMDQPPSPLPVGSVYLIVSDGLGKIGFTKRDVEQRLSEIQRMSPSKLSLRCLFVGTKRDEHALHERFSDWRRHGEWFDISDGVIEAAFMERAK